MIGGPIKFDKKDMYAKVSVSAAFEIWKNQASD